MRKFDSLPSKKRVFKAKHLEPCGFHLDFILLPIGYSYNAEWLEAKKGDTIRFHDGGAYKICYIRIVKVKGGLAEILSRIRYGISIAGCIQRWQDNAKLEGNARSAISTDECLWIVYEKEPETGSDGGQI